MREFTPMAATQPWVTRCDAISPNPRWNAKLPWSCGTDLDGADPALTEQRVADAIEACHIACEIIDNRYRDPSAIGIPSLIADDFFHAAFVIGAANPDWRSQDLTHADAAIEIDGTRTTGNAAEVMSAFTSVLWLARRLAASGQHLRAGEIVLSGAVVGPVPITLPARSVSLHISGFAPLTLQA